MAKLAVVTGGMGGIGEAISRKLAQAGHCVVVTYSPSNTTSENWLTSMREEGLDVLGAEMVDVANFDSCRQCVARIKSHFGDIDILVNNAGITRDVTLKKMSFEDWDAVLKVNLYSIFNMTKHVVDDMLQRSWGRVINISSVCAEKGSFGQTNYSAAKAGMHGFTKALALEVASKGVTVNTISPGYIATKMVQAIPEDILSAKILPHIPNRRLGMPEEVAGLAAYLSSEEASYINGANLSINGGQHMH